MRSDHGDHQPRTRRQGAGDAQGRAAALRRARIKGAACTALVRAGQGVAPRKPGFDVRHRGETPLGRGDAAFRPGEPVAKRVPQDPGPGRAFVGQRVAGSAQPLGAPESLLRRRHRARARLDGPVADRHFGARGRRSRQDADGVAAPCLRRAGTRRKAQERRHRHRKRGHRPTQAVARGGDAAQGRGERPLPTGRVRRRSVAGASRRGHGRVQKPGRVLPPHVSYREPEGDAGRRGAAPLRPRRRPGSETRCDGLRALPPTSTRTARAIGTRRNPRSPSWRRTAPSNSSAIPTR